MKRSEFWNRLLNNGENAGKPAKGRNTMRTLTKSFMALLGCAAILLAAGCVNPISTDTSLAIELSTPQDSFTLGHVYYSVSRFNQEIEASRRAVLGRGDIPAFGR